VANVKDKCTLSYPSTADQSMSYVYVVMNSAGGEQQDVETWYVVWRDLFQVVHRLGVWC
jgi:hypothetical protein